MTPAFERLMVRRSAAAVARANGVPLCRERIRLGKWPGYSFEVVMEIIVLPPSPITMIARVRLDFV